MEVKVVVGESLFMIDLMKQLGIRYASQGSSQQVGYAKLLRFTFVNSKT